MMAAFVNGKPIMGDYNGGGVAYSAGDVIVIGGLACVAHEDNPPFGSTQIKDALALEGGIYQMIADVTSPPIGSFVYWDPVAHKVTLTQLGNNAFGYLIAGPTGLMDGAGPASDGDSVLVLHKPSSTNIVATLSIGGSTAAAGSTTTDAGVLPAATAKVYPTTASDGTKGVRVNAADKVTGRQLYIGNQAAAVMKVYPPSGGTINGGAADAAFSSVSGKGVIMVCLSATSNTWLAW